MKTTYTVTAKSLDYKNLTISFGDLSFLCVKTVAEMLGYAFRQIDIICDQTGEIAYSQYKSQLSDWFSRYDTEMAAIQKVVLFLAEH